MDVLSNYMTSAVVPRTASCWEARECVEEGVMFLETRMSVVEYVYHRGGEYTEGVKQKSVEMFSESQAPHRNTDN
jgi:hypothetical protein